MPAAERVGALQSYFGEEQRHAMYRPEFSASIEGSTSGRLACMIPKDVDDPIQQMIAAEMSLRLHADYLRKVDVASSAHGLEVRVPFLDAAMLELAAELPVRYKIAPNGETKILSRRLAAKYLPPDLQNRPKQGFSIPLDRWSGPRMRAFFQDLLLSRTSKCHMLIRPEVVRGVWSAFENPVAGLSRYQRYQQLFLVASLELWLRRWNPGLP